MIKYLQVVLLNLYFLFIQGSQFSLTQFYTDVVRYNPNVITSTQNTPSTLTISGSYAYTAPHSTGFQCSNAALKIDYTKTGLRTTSNFFGTSTQYFAEMISNMVYMGSIYSFTSSTTITAYVHTFTSGSVQVKPVIVNSTVIVSNRLYQIYAELLCGTTDDAIYIHIFEQKSLTTFFATTISSLTVTQTIKFKSGTYLYLQLGYVVPAACSATLIPTIAQNFIFAALKDTLLSLNTVFTNFPSAFDLYLNNNLLSPFTLFGGTSGNTIKSTDGNTFLAPSGNLISNNAYSGFAYSNNNLINQQQLGFSTNNFGKYFSHLTPAGAFASIYDIAPSGYNDYFQVSFSLASGSFQNCYAYTGTMMVDSINYAFQWQVLYHSCASNSTPFLNSILINLINQYSDSTTLFTQPYTSSTCGLTNIINRVNYPRQRVYSMMFLQYCQSNYQPQNPNVLQLGIVFSLIQSAESNCDPTCNTCSGKYNYSCLACYTSNQFRILTQTSCICQPGYYDNSTSICQVCDPNCLTCQINSTNCLTCDPTTSRQLVINNCTCLNRQADAVVGAHYGICIACQYTCFSCVDTTTQCISCAQSDFRTLAGISPNICKCNLGYFENGVSVCGACDYSCLTCSGSSNNQCLTCNTTSNRITVPNNVTCPCKTNYYFDDGINQICQQCHYSCLTCSSSSNTGCLSCDKGDFRFLDSTSVCACQATYFDNLNKTCFATITICDYSCFECLSRSGSTCLTCSISNFRQISNNSCLCIDGYYESGVSVCKQCDFSCKTCDNHGCITCPEPKYLRTNVPDGSNSCLCILGAIQNNSEIQCITVCGDGVKMFNEQCDDGNLITKDGCNELCKIEQGFQCHVIEQESVCTISPILNCIKVLLTSDPLQCQQCADQYIISGDQTACIACDPNCPGCLTPDLNNPSQCAKCSQLSLGTLPTKPNCKKCLQSSLILQIQGRDCPLYCGDGIVRQDDGEKCDDGGTIDGDGCSSTCQIEPNYDCLEHKPYSKIEPLQIQLIAFSICTKRKKLVARLIFGDGLTNNQIKLIFSEKIKQIDFCQMFNLTIKSLNSTQFSFKSKEIDPQSCLISLSINATMVAKNRIKLVFKKASISNSNESYFEASSISILSRPQPYYSPQQKQEAKELVEIQSNVNIIVICMGLLVVLLGGVEMYWSILDILSWLNVFYFVNVNFPLQINKFYEFASWTEFLEIPLLIELNKPEDAYYQPGPEYFTDKGFNGCFLGSIFGDVQFCLVGLSVYMVASSMCQIIEWIFSSMEFVPNKESVKLNNIHTEMVSQRSITIPGYLQPVYKRCQRIRGNYLAIFVKLILLVFLDFQIASIIQLRANQFTRHPFIAVNMILASLWQMFALLLPYYFYTVINQSPQLLENESYESIYGAIYENLLIQTPQGKFYCVFQVIKKTLFVYCLVLFFNQPLMQTITCTIVCSINILLVLYKNPFDSKLDLVKFMAPDLAIFGSIATTIIFAMNDKFHLLTPHQVYNLGWAVLSMIVSSVVFQIAFLLLGLKTELVSRIKSIYMFIFKKN